MRLIDADALSEELSTLAMMITGLRAGKGVLNEFMKEYRKSVLRIVDEQPTIDPSTLRPKGEWERRMEQDSRIHTDMAWCSHCGYHMIFKRQFDSFCPNCGADMRGAAHDS